MWRRGPERLGCEAQTCSPPALCSLHMYSSQGVNALCRAPSCLTGSLAAFAARKYRRIFRSACLRHVHHEVSPVARPSNFALNADDLETTGGWQTAREFSNFTEHPVNGGDLATELVHVDAVLTTAVSTAMLRYEAWAAHCLPDKRKYREMHRSAPKEHPAMPIDATPPPLIPLATRV